MTGMIRGLLAATALASLATTAFAQDVQGVIGGLPTELKAQYDGAPQKVLPSAWDNFTAPPKPWKWCHSESYQGNPWRVTVTKELKRLVDGLIADGTVSSFEVSDSNNDASQQINQIRAFIDKKCSIITSIPGSATALDDAIDAAAKAGIPFITAAGSVTSPNAINVDSNYARWGYDMMAAIGKAQPDGASILLVEGIAGHPIVVQERQGADKALAENPKLKISRNVNGNWTANVTKTVVLQAIATNPAPIDAVWTTGSESRVVAEAFAEAGRPAPLITGSITGDALGYWKANPDKYRFEGHAVLPHWTAQTLFRVGERMLDGQKPKLNTLLIPIPPVHTADLGAWYKDCMTTDAVSIFPIPPKDPMPEEWLDAYFSNPAPTKGWDYSKVPDACAK
ncbi:ABC transporter substrate-binding protein [Mesorhizobium sp. LMG17149]|jgi:ribose transport system substrate-binding protein|uniref:ABC transporter substrate-binding protein n=1 Tax=unclassified Mesorhizobium TaxID=325217 RepID=UPI000FE53F4B|nr:MULTISPECIES: ABC transporter substrate-binding protein [unclassified Mesorhizobium]MCQ8873944.1 ABC transporter substrate-binding protein [Mesorhizobium sp. LMG17149]RWN32036.1 MAG: ribose ABC transporter substrate-binding protein [Mesorhizobium sp.]RWN93619.1 MAG: ribose ABC transporter substrate-binding protein [Mesorhizobium sp.]RWO43823.1 MAG: ribose ABC transporter substrate-binding protein [Mesorhizobium sp.]RWP93852.1 MAG: ribose ABC transporter substrate-binding protein [Mesorhizob